MATSLPDRPPFAIRARILTPLARGGTRYEADGRIEVDERGRLTAVGPYRPEPGDEQRPPIDLRPLVVMPGMVDIHMHLPQLPNAGVGAGLHLLDWLERYIFPLERGFDEATAELLAPAACRAFAASGTTTAVMYGAVYEPSLDAAFRAAEAHGMRAVIGKVMMDRGSYDSRLPENTILDVSLRQSADLCARWHGKDDGRLQYAFTPRFAITCSREMLQESAALAASTGAYWQTHLSEDHDELDAVARLFPEAIDYLDVYDRASALGPRTILAHAIHLSDREVGRLAESRSAVAHCPASNLFLSSGAMPLSHYLAHGIRVGMGSDVGAGPELSIFANMRAGAYTQSGLHVLADGRGPEPLDPLDWLRLATIGGAKALGMDDVIGSLEAGKEADMIAVDPRLVAPVEGMDSDDPAEIMSRLAFRPHSDMVRLAWVRGRSLEGPPGFAAS
jgi:guanine deaminase